MKKGITPVIAVVLLLLITVGAVASMYGLYQQITSDQSQLDQLNQQRQAQATEIDFSSVYANSTESPAYINASIRNTGSRTINMSDELEMAFIPDGSDSSVSFDVLNRTYDDLDLEEQECFTNSQDEESVEPGETYTCSTGVPFPSAASSWGIVVNYKSTGKSWDHTCSPSTSSSITC